MDDQQRRQMRLGWAGGIIDGEGTINLCAVRVPRRRSTLEVLIYPRFRVSNTNTALLDEFADVLRAEGLAFWQGRANAKIRNAKHKAQGIIVINGMKRMARFCSTLLPYVIAKREQIEVVQAFIAARLSRPYNSPLSGGEVVLVDRLRVLNRRGTESARSEANTPSLVRARTKMIESGPHGKLWGGETVTEYPANGEPIGCNKTIRITSSTWARPG